MKLNILSINPITNIPSLRYLVTYFLEEKKAKIEITEVHISKLNNYYQNLQNLRFDHIINFENFNAYQLGLPKITYKKYTKIISKLFSIYQSKEPEIIYTNDFQVVYLSQKIKTLYPKKKVKTIYHQFELLEERLLGKFSGHMYRSVLRNAYKIDLCIFPEINRLDYFRNTAQLKKKIPFLFPNTCAKETGISKGPSILDHIPPTNYIVLHVGSVGGKQHYFENFLKAIQKFDASDKIDFIFLGRITKEIEEIRTSISSKNIHFIDSIPHEELRAVYQRTNLGVILYKGTSLNYEYCAPNKLYEFWSHGIPVIGHHLKGLTPLFTENILGTLTDFNDENVLTKRIAQLKENENLDKAQLSTYFDQNLSIPKYLKLFDQELNKLI